MAKEKRNYKNEAEQILPLVGGKENVSGFLHCMTRLRVTPVDASKIDMEALAALPGVIKVQEVAGVTQIVIGPGHVDEVHDEFAILVGKSGGSIDENLDGNKGDEKWTTKVVQTMQAIVMPAIGVLGGVALINALVTILSIFGVSAENPIMQILAVMGTIVSSFIGVFFGYNANKHFGGTPFIAVVLALFMYSPGITGIVIFGIELKAGVGGVIAIVAIAILAAYIEKFFKKVVRKDLQLILVPFFTILGSLIPLLLIVVPISALLTSALTTLFTLALDSNQYVYILICGIIGAIWGLLVMSGMHITFATVMVPIAVETGIAPFGAVQKLFPIVMIGLAAAIMLKERNNVELKEIGISGLLIAFTGITEPLLYGVVVPRPKAIIYMILGGLAGGLVIGLFNVQMMYPSALGAFAMLNIEDFANMWYYNLLAWITAAGVPFILYTLFPAKSNQYNN